MFGAIIGDVIGSRFEFNNIKSKDFELFHKGCRPTDDSIMTTAIADAVLKGYVSNNKDGIIDTLKYWGQKYPNAGYGGRFFEWVLTNDRKPYNSFGNGAAMRISPIGWCSDTYEDVVKNATAVTEVTHNHPEGIKAAIVVANCIRLARQNETKENIIKYIKENYNIDFDYEELKKTFMHEEETCQATVPQALYCFAISKDFRDCLRTTISIGGDCDTTAAISCAIAEAYYGIPSWIRVEFAKMKYLPKDISDVLLEFTKKYYFAEGNKCADYEYTVPENRMIEAKEICIKENILGGEERLKKYKYGLCVPGEFTNAPYFYGIMDTIDVYDKCYEEPFIIYDGLQIQEIIKLII